MWQIADSKKRETEEIETGDDLETGRETLSHEESSSGGE
jgi:hypothetical protein